MGASEDLIDFDVLEGQKENIQALPGGRSAKKLAAMYSPSPLHKLSTPTPADTRNVNDCIRAEYEAEIANIAESDDPLEVFDRYARWILDAYPSAQATPQSQLHTVLERATKAFVNSAQYKNDPRYIRMWIHYIHFFSDSPRETYIFMSRHAIGERLALYYEEYAAWLEGAGRWAQAEEVYKLGIEREARPVQRLMRKFKEFEQRLSQQPDSVAEPTSPALPTARPALVAKVDPFAAARAADPQARRPTSGSGSSSKPAKSKLAIFSDADEKPPVLSSRDAGSKGWDTIGSMAERKKENTMEPKPWVGETLKTGAKKTAAPKMAVFRDTSLSKINNVVVDPTKSQTTVHPNTGKRERIFVNLAVLYPTPDEPGTELGFEEVMAASRGWLDHSWEQEVVDMSVVPEPTLARDIAETAENVGNKLQIHRDIPAVDENGASVEQQPRPARGSKKKKKLMEYNETQIIKAKLDSPSGPKLKKRNSSEPTMTLHTRAATDDIYDIFNTPSQQHAAGESSGEEDFTDGDYSTDAESNATSTKNVMDPENVDDARSESEWSEFEAHKHVPDMAGEQNPDDEMNSARVPDLMDEDFTHENDITPPGLLESQDRVQVEDGDWERPEDPETPEDHIVRKDRTAFVPIPPEDYDPPTRPYRDPAEVANSRLPFMTPITERTEVSLEIDATTRREAFKTPCRRDHAPIMTEEEEEEEDEALGMDPMSSPLREVVSPEGPVAIPRGPLVPKATTPLATKVLGKSIPPKGPIIKDVQCNPVDKQVCNEILAKLNPPLSTYSGFYDHRQEKSERGAEIRKFAKSMTTPKTGRGDRGSSLPASVIIELPDVRSTYTVKRQVGAGAYGPVYMVENSDPDDNRENDENAVATMGRGGYAISHRHHAEAVKMELPPTPWEFYMMRLAHSRLGPQHRASASISYAHEMHLYKDEGFLFLPFHPHGTLLDVVNHFRSEQSGVMDENLAMFFTIELMRTAEALHSKGLIHGDIKPDNCLLRLDNLVGNENDLHSQGTALSSQYRPDGRDGWDARGLVFIDFGRSIDMRAFVPEVQFIADWKTTAQDCAEAREGRPWTWQIDYHGLAGTIHCLLFGRYIETVRCDQGGIGLGGRKYRIRENFKRYWQTELWAECFDVLLNPGSFLNGGSMPVLKPMRAVRERMEQWLVANCEKGVGLKAQIGRLEAYAKSRRH